VVVPKPRAPASLTAKPTVCCARSCQASAKVGPDFVRTTVVALELKLSWSVTERVGRTTTSAAPAVRGALEDKTMTVRVTMRLIFLNMLGQRPRNYMQRKWKSY
jgi:hypothetical protein